MLKIFSRKIDFFDFTNFFGMDILQNNILIHISQAFIIQKTILRAPQVAKSNSTTGGPQAKNSTVFVPIVDKPNFLLLHTCILMNKAQFCIK